MLEFFIKNHHVLKTAGKAALVVGTVLAFINHFEEILGMSLTRTDIIQILVTYLVPFSVATYAGMRQVKRLTETNTN